MENRFSPVMEFSLELRLMDWSVFVTGLCMKVAAVRNVGYVGGEPKWKGVAR
jgi:hypothetical protein